MKFCQRGPLKPINKPDWLFDMKKNKFLLFIILALNLCELHAADSSKRLNVLFIAIDDLRPQLGCYGLDYMLTPNLDNLARHARLFNRHYVQIPTCGASRCSILTGFYPRRNEDLTNFATFERKKRLDQGSNESAVPSLPEFFRNAGYQTVSLGKVGNTADGTYKGTTEFPNAWDVTWGPTGVWKSSQHAIAGYANGKFRKPGVTPPTERGNVDDHGYPDALIADEAISRLHSFSKDKPFFLAVGLFKPHLPFTSPAKYWGPYDGNKIPPPKQDQPPKGTQLGPNGELTHGYGGWQERGKILPDEANLLRQGYSAAVSYVDAQVGRILDELEKSGLADNTIVVVWGDHGWHLGELGAWGKHTLMEWSLRSTLIIRMPGQQKPGVASDTIVESVGLYPTLADLCGLTAPRELDGQSFSAQVASSGESTDRPALSWWYRGAGATVNSVGRSIRTARWRYTEWENGSRELYDHDADPDEAVNLAGTPRYDAIIQKLGGEIQRSVPAWQKSSEPSGGKAPQKDVDP